MQYKYISISGTIGAGKTELAKRLAKYKNAKLLLEEFDSNTFLDKFYKNPDRYAFPLEVSFLVERFQQIEYNFLPKNSSLHDKVGIVLDYLFEKSMIFAENNLPKDQYKLFKRIFLMLTKSVKVPDITVYIHRPVEVLLQNINKRGRNFENKITHKYLENIQSSYLSFLKNMQNRRVIILQLDDMDYIDNNNNLNHIFAIFDTKFDKKLNIINMSSTPQIVT